MRIAIVDDEELARGRLARLSGERGKSDVACGRLARLSGERGKPDEVSVGVSAEVAA